MAKRHRSENDVEDPEGPPVRAELWYSDGTVVVQAERTQFRVYAGILSQHSPVLKEMLAKPAVELVDGCPLLFLPDDKAQDIEYLLNYLYVPG
jgi:BTB/POZ domain